MNHPKLRTKKEWQTIVSMSHKYNEFKKRLSGHFISYLQSIKTNTTAALMIIATPSHPFKMLAIMYCHSAASNEATKTK
jgi:hypothetical protein